MKMILENDGRFNFHNVSGLEIRVKPENIRDKFIILTQSQVRRIANHFCGAGDCVCGSGPRGMEEIEMDRWIIWK